MKTKTVKLDPPHQMAATLESTKIPARVIALNILQLVGILAASLAIPSPETAAVLAMLPEAIVGNIGKIALVLVAAKPAINTVADLIDNGKLDGSYKGGLGRLGLYMLLCLAAGVMLTGCGMSVDFPNGVRLGFEYTGEDHP